MTILLKLLFIHFLSAQGLQLTWQTQCLCDLSEHCSDQTQHYWFFQGTNPQQVYIATSAPSSNIYELQFNQQNINSYRNNIGLLEIPSLNGPIAVAVHFDQSGRYRYQNRLDTDLNTLRLELAHWERMSRLEHILFVDNGVHPDPEERGFGTNLIVLSDRIGLLPSPERIDNLSLR